MEFAYLAVIYSLSISTGRIETYKQEVKVRNTKNQEKSIGEGEAMVEGEGGQRCQGYENGRTYDKIKEKHSFLIMHTDCIDINNLPQACVLDRKEFENIQPFHGDLPYFKVSSGPNGILRFFIGGIY